MRGLSHDRSSEGCLAQPCRKVQFQVALGEGCDQLCSIKPPTPETSQALNSVCVSIVCVSSWTARSAAHRHKPKIGKSLATVKLTLVPRPPGLELTFFSGVYGTCIGAVNKFGTEEKSLIGLSGIFIGIGEILGRLSFSLKTFHFGVRLEKLVL